MKRYILTCSAMLGGFMLMSQSSDRFVFSTNSDWSSDKITYAGEVYRVVKKKKCKDELEQPNECYWMVDLGTEDLPKLRVEGEPLQLTVEDINQDGTEELIILTPGLGAAWTTIHVFTLGDPSMTSGPFWFEPFEAFGWYGGFEGDRVCDAQVFWDEGKSSVRILTTNAAEEDFRCTQELIQKWVWQ